MPNVGEVRAKISGDASGFTSAASSATAALGGLSGAFKTALAAGTAFAGAKFFQSSIEQAGQFEKEMREVSTLLQGDVNQQIGAMREEILSMSAALPKSPDELGAAAYDVVSAGIEGTSNQMKVLRESAKLATGGLGTTEQAVDLMTTALNTFNFEADEAGRVANVFFQTVDAGKNTVAELSNFFGQAASIANQVGVTFEEINAITAVMTRRTGNAQKAQRGIRQILNAMLKPGEKLKQLYEELGVRSLPQLVERSGGLQKALQKVKDATQGNIQEFADAVGSSRALSSALLSVGDAGEEVQGLIQGFNKDMGKLEKAVNRVNDSFDAQLKLLKNEFEALQIDIGKDALPQVRDLIDFLRSKRVEETGSFLSNALEKSQRGFTFIAKGADSSLGILQEYVDFLRGESMVDVAEGGDEGLFGVQTQTEAQRDRLRSLRDLASDLSSQMMSQARGFAEANDLNEKETERLISDARRRAQGFQEIIRELPSVQDVQERLVEPTNQSVIRRIRKDFLGIKREFETNAENLVDSTVDEFQKNALFGQIGGGIAEPFMQNIRNGIDDLKGEVAAMEGDFQELFADVSREELAEKRFEEIRQAVQSKFGQAMLEREDIQEAMAAGQWEQAAEQIKDEFDELTQDMIDIGDRLAQAGLFGGLVGGDNQQQDLPGFERIEEMTDMLKTRETLRGIGAGGREGQMRETDLEQAAKQGTKEGAKQGVKQGAKQEERRKVQKGLDRFNVGGVTVGAEDKPGAIARKKRAEQIIRGGKGARMQAGARSRFGLNPNSSLASDDNDGFSRGLASGGSQMGLAPQGGGFSPGPQAGFGGQIQGANRRTRRALGFGGQQEAKRNLGQNERQTQQFVQDVNKTMKKQNQFLEDVDANIQRIRRRLDRIENQR